MVSFYRLTNEKKPFTVKREQHPIEKGYHETLHYSYDLYLPIVSSSSSSSNGVILDMEILIQKVRLLSMKH